MDPTQQPTTPVTPEVSTTPAPVTPAAPVEPTVNVDDLFPQAAPTATPAAPTASNQPAAPGDPADPEQKIMNDVNARFSEFDKSFNQKMEQTQSAVEQKIHRTSEIASFFSSEAGKDFASYRDQITKVATDPRFIGLKMSRVIGMALEPSVLMQMGAKMAEAARTQAASGRTGGNNAAGVIAQQTQPKDFSKMSSADFAAYQEEVLRRQPSR